MLPFTLRAFVPLTVPIPTLPETIKPLVGAFGVDEPPNPIATRPVTLKPFAPENVPMPTFPNTAIPFAGAPYAKPIPIPP